MRMNLTPPTRRTRYEASGLTPAAKRPDQRTIVPDPPETTISHVEMANVVQKMHVQYASDMAWIGTIFEAVQDHAARLDVQKAVITESASMMVATRKIVSDNDANTKIILELNDTESKRIIDANDVNTKQILSVNVALQPARFFHEQLDLPGLQC